MGIFKKALHSKIDIFVKFESAINLEIRGQIKKTWIPSIWVTRTICMHFHENLGRSCLMQLQQCLSSHTSYNYQILNMVCGCHYG